MVYVKRLLLFNLASLCVCLLCSVSYSEAILKINGRIQSIIANLVVLLSSCMH